MKIVFMGTPDFSVATLEKLIEKHNVVGVYTRAPKESGRGKKVNKTPIHLLAESKGIEVRTPKTLRDKEEQDTLKAYDADVIVVAAPYWDLSFPSILKVFFEHINVLKLVFDYSDKGEIVSLCKAKKLYYITTKGGFGPDDFGFRYIEALSKTFYGIKDIALIKAESLDIYGNNVEDILAKAKEDIDKVV